MPKKLELALVAVILTSFAIGPVQAQGVLPDGTAQPPLKGSVQQPDGQAQGGDATAPVHKPLILQVRMETDSVIGTKNEIFPAYEEKAGVTQEDYQKLTASPLVQARVEEWKIWFQQFYDSLKPNKDSKLPADLRCKINLTVLKNGKVSAGVEWMDATDDSGTKKPVDDLIATARSLKPESVKFPDNSYIDMLKLDVYLTGRDNSYVLDTAQTLALDYDR